MSDTIEVIPAHKATDEILKGCYDVAMLACAANLRDEVDIEALLGDEGTFMETTRSPEKEIEREGGTRTNNQECHGSKLAIARDESGDIMAWAESTHTVSGGGDYMPHNKSLPIRAYRLGKRLSLMFNYLELKAPYILPGRENENLDVRLAYDLTSLKNHAWPLMPVLQYAFLGLVDTDFNPVIGLEALGFHDTHHDMFMDIGGLTDVRRVRMQASSVQLVHKLLGKMIDASESQEQGSSLHIGKLLTRV